MKLKDVTRLENPMVLADPFPDECFYPICPLCESDNYNLVYFDSNDEIIGCNDCVVSKSADEYLEMVEEGELAEAEYWQERKYDEEKEDEIMRIRDK